MLDAQPVETVEADSSPPEQIKKVVPDDVIRRKPKEPGPLRWIVGGLIGLLILVILSHCIGGGPQDDGTDIPPEATAAAEAPASAEVVSPAQIAYVVRTTSVLAVADRTGRIIGELRRGQNVAGRFVGQDSDPWFQIEEGAYQGNFLSGDNLALTPPPTLFGRPGSRTVVRNENIRFGPVADGQVLDWVTRGEALEVTGEIEGGWVEVLMPRGGVGYVPIQAFTPEPSLDPRVTQKPSIPDPREVCREETLNGQIQTLCLNAQGVWVRRGSPRREPASVPPPEPPAATIPPPAPPLYITGFGWSRQPNPDEQDRVLPSRARDRGQSGRVGMDCAIDSSGSLQDCRVTSEEPAGWGFREAAMRSVRYYRTERLNSAGESTAGRRVRFAIRFDPPLE